MTSSQDGKLIVWVKITILIELSSSINLDLGRVHNQQGARSHIANNMGDGLCLLPKWQVIDHHHHHHHQHLHQYLHHHNDVPVLLPAVVLITNLLCSLSRLRMTVRAKRRSDYDGDDDDDADDADDDDDHDDVDENHDDD